MEQPAYGLVGRGRLATHLARYLELESRDFTTWHRGLDRSPAEILAGADIILLAISDDALNPFIADHPELGDRTRVHFSGSLSIEGVAGLHPLMTFGPGPYGLETYRSIPFVTERGAAGFTDIFPGLPNPSWSIEPEQKPLYHALCVMAGNFPTLLWSKAFEEFETRLGLPHEILRPYLSRTLENTLNSGGRALTGPLARGDTETMRRNIAALGNDTYAGLYRAFARCHGTEEV